MCPIFVEFAAFMLRDLRRALQAGIWGDLPKLATIGTKLNEGAHNTSALCRYSVGGAPVCTEKSLGSSFLRRT